MNTTIFQVVHFRHKYSNPSGAFHRYIHKTHAIAFHLRAAGRCIIGNETVSLRPPFLALLAKGERDDNGFDGPNEAYWCLFHGDVVRAEPGGNKVALQADKLRICQSHIRQLSAKEADTTTRLFEQLRASFQKPDLASKIQAHATLGQILATWAQPATEKKENLSTKARLYRTLIEQYIDNPQTSLRELADQVGATMDHLGVLFHREFGISPLDYRTQMRLSRASEMLLSSVLPVTEIARLTGFADPNYFARAFRKAYRCSPRQYAAAHQLYGSGKSCKTMPVF